MKSAPTGEQREDQGLSKQQRISQSSIFREAFDNGPHFVGQYIVMWLRSGEDANAQLGVIASKRTFPRAVDRARAKRLLRESFRLHRSKMKTEYDIVLVAKKRIKGVKRSSVDEDLMKLAKEAGLLK